MKVYNKIVCLESYAFFLTSQKRNYEAEGKHIDFDVSEY